MRLRQRVVGELDLIGRAELVVIEVGGGQPRPLLEHDDGEARRRQLLGEDAAGGAGADDDEIDECRSARTGRLGSSVPRQRLALASAS